MTTFTVGSYHVTRIEEMLTPGFMPGFLFPDYSAGRLRRAPELLSDPRFWDEPSQKVMSSMHSWMIRDDRHTILIDTGCGNDKTRALPLFERFHQLHLPYLERLAEAGVRPEDVTLVICTHLHIDHVGWNTRLVDGRWVPTFPNAKYIFSRREFEHWQSPDGRPRHAAGEHRRHRGQRAAGDRGRPGRVHRRRLEDHRRPVLPGRVRPHRRPRLLKLESGNDAAIFPGDSLHQPMQVFRPDWNSRFCEQAGPARATRRSILDYCHDRNALLLPAHFGAPHGGYVTPPRGRLRLHAGRRPRRRRLSRPADSRHDRRRLVHTESFLSALRDAAGSAQVLVRRRQPRVLRQRHLLAARRDAARGRAAADARDRPSTAVEGRGRARRRHRAARRRHVVHQGLPARQQPERRHRHAQARPACSRSTSPTATSRSRPAAPGRRSTRRCCRPA